MRAELLAAGWGVLLLVASAPAQSELEATLEPGMNPAITWRYPVAEFRQALQADFEAMPAAESVPRDANEATTSVRSVKRAALLSAILPGAGQIYNRSYLSGLVFLGIEAGSWYVYAHYTDLGDQKTASYKSFADEHWMESEYWRSLVEDGAGCSAGDLACLKAYERANFSHFLPDSRNQTYYENIGKYDQFNAGWDDSRSGKARQRDSDRREAYTLMRRDANDQYKTATRGVTVVLFNHVLSALHAAFITHRHNAAQMQTSLGMNMKRYGRELVPAVNLGLAW